MSQRSALDRLKDNLLQLEINTILKDEMTAQPMPALPHALIDVAKNYYNKMIEYDVPAHLFFRAEIKPDTIAPDTITIGPFSAPSIRDYQPLTLDIDTFDRLRWAARTAEGKISNPEQRQIVVRICNNCDTLKAILKRAGAKETGGPTRNQLADIPHEIHGLLSVDRDDYAVVQKIWDVGTEQVMVQTAISVTGDVNTRIRRSLTPAEQAALIEVHKVAVTVSVESWQHLVATAVDLLKTGLSILGGRRGR